MPSYVKCESCGSRGPRTINNKIAVNLWNSVPREFDIVQSVELRRELIAKYTGEGFE